MDQSSILKSIEQYNSGILDNLTSKNVPLQVKIENMEDGTIGFMAVFETENRSIEFYVMNAQLNNNENFQPLLIIERKHDKIKRVKFMSPDNRSLFHK